MKAQRGDHIVLAGGHVGDKVRDGEIVEVRGENGAPPYLVRWSDGHEGLIFPGPNTGVLVTGSQGAGAEAEQGTGAEAGAAAENGSTGEPRPVHEWQIRVSIFETGDDTTAKVALISDSLGEIDAMGESHRADRDPAVPRIGDEVAVARALRHLSEQLLARASTEVEDATGEIDVTIRPR